MAIVVEPGGAMLAGKVDAAGKRVGVTISGGNIGLERFLAVMGG